MTRVDRPFVRVYHDDLQRDYPAVWDDDHQLATWLRLLVVADKLWPAPAELPRREKPSSIARLVASKILEILPRHRFRLKGLDAERQRRYDRAAGAAAVRWDSPSNADASANAMPTRAGAGPSALRPPLSDSASDITAEDAVLTWLASVGATVMPDGNGYHRELVTFVGRQGAAKVIDAMKARYAAGDRSSRQLLYGAINDLEQIHRPSSKAKPKGFQPQDEEVAGAWNRR